MADFKTEANQLQQNPPIEERAAYNKRAAAIVTGTSVSTIHRAIKSGRLKAAFVGRRVVIRGAELMRWLRSCES